MSPRHAMVLAAGFGTRMGALTANRPKPLLEVADRSLIDRSLDHLEVAGVERAVVNLHYRGDMLRSHLATRRRPEIAFSEEPEILDTGGGVAQALPVLGPDPFFVMNADNVWTGPDPLQPLMNAWGDDVDALLLLVQREDTLAYSRQGDFFLDGAGRLRRRGTAPNAPFVYTGAQILAPAAFEGVPSGAFSLNLVWDRLIDTGRIRGVIHRGAWVDVGTPAGLAIATEAVAGARA